MKKLPALILAAAAAALAASAYAAPGPAPAKDGVKDPESGITLHPPKHEENAKPGSKQEKFAAEVKAAMRRVASATKKTVSRADQALRDVVHDKA